MSKQWEIKRGVFKCSENTAGRQCLKLINQELVGYKYVHKYSSKLFFKKEIKSCVYLLLLLLLLLLLSRFSRVRLCATPQTAAHQAPPSLGFSRQEHWSGLPFPSKKSIIQLCLKSHFSWSPSLLTFISIYLSHVSSRECT